LCERFEKSWEEEEGKVEGWEVCSKQLEVRGRNDVAQRPITMSHLPHRAGNSLERYSINVMHLGIQLIDGLKHIP
jgi:hypothetical protein